ncbi:flagellar biosynthetic protein FliQ [Amylibacter sp. SFDW26]|uniref:EscS/YscS/HrcS family type III secretion system export apparatus protein n=1 Tax=Amylibacter sp. SFDW26 TaxID=2652722 RepID=UPI0012625DDE|nr:flagellar biosynthetic protein FliQ [Amylibacter sp. SFDW26]KAB7613602.1 flagellar biosynthetic protein FliQ [Amylibacter sp. SFDW26]
MNDFPGYLTSFMMDVILLAGVPLAVATVCGLLVSVFQAVTQIQDQTLSQTVKIAAIVGVLLGFGGSLVSPLIQNTMKLFDEFGQLGF